VEKQYFLRAVLLRLQHLRFQILDFHRVIMSGRELRNMAEMLYGITQSQFCLGYSSNSDVILKTSNGRGWIAFLSPMAAALNLENLSGEANGHCNPLGKSIGHRQAQGCQPPISLVTGCDTASDLTCHFRNGPSEEQVRTRPTVVDGHGQNRALHVGRNNWPCSSSPPCHWRDPRPRSECRSVDGKHPEIGLPSYLKRMEDAMKRHVEGES
jgi:hypothetical protein